MELIINGLDSGAGIHDVEMSSSKTAMRLAKLRGLA